VPDNRTPRASHASFLHDNTELRRAIPLLLLDAGRLKYPAPERTCADVAGKREEDPLPDRHTAPDGRASLGRATP
jgi:hypothetical protein